jgi:hypothetical protein
MSQTHEIGPEGPTEDPSPPTDRRTPSGVRPRELFVDESLEAPQRLVCTCARKPLLARVGILQGAPFLEIKASKSGRPLVDVVVTEGTVVIRCRECFRFHRIKVGTVLHERSPMMDLQ